MHPLPPGRELLLDAGWRFHPGDIPAPLSNRHIAAYMANKAGWARGAAKPSFDDSDWRVLDVPHDWAVEGAYSPDHHINNGFLPRGVGWYRRHFCLDESERHQRLAIRFDGVSTHCTVYVNGHLLHRHFCGYTQFTVDFSDVANFGEDQLNVIAVRVDATQIEGWWYEGAGIYRHVWLIRSSPVHIADQGVVVRPERITEGQWKTHVETTVASRLDAARTVLVRSEVVDDGGAIVAGGFAEAHIPPRATVSVMQKLATTSPRLWSIDRPNLYSLRTTLLESPVAAEVDRVETQFGYRTIRFEPAAGLFLNDQPVKLLGTCNHQDHAGVGVAVPDSIHEFRIRRLKDMGSNALRCAHNPPAPELLSACDRLGMLVMDENRNFGSSPEHLSQVAAMLRRDRNHPSVILWSICNEEAIQGTQVGANIAHAMAHLCHSLDPSRPVTAAVSGGMLNDGGHIPDALDVMGINYQLATYGPFHAKRPSMPLFAAETHCALSTRGTYATDASRFEFDSYDTEKAAWGNTARETWRAISGQPFVAGLFAWTGFDYRGEPSPHTWPSVTSHWGIMDLCGFEKDSFHLHRAWWTRGGAAAPFVHLLPHWNWTEPGAPVRVCVYSNCDECELTLNGRPLGRKPIDPIDMAEWVVPFESGVLVARGYRAGDGQELAAGSVATTGEPVALGLEVHPSARFAEAIPADGAHAIPITVFAIDSEGLRVPTAEIAVDFETEGVGRILGVGNGDPNCHEPDKGNRRSLFRGLAQVVVQAGREAGRIVLHGRDVAGRLQPAVLELTTFPAQTDNRVPAVRPRCFVSDWRMSPLSIERPDPNVVPSDQDMNTWQRIDPSRGPHPTWQGGSGAGAYATYRASFTPPRSLQKEGGLVVFRSIEGVRSEFYLDGVLTEPRRVSGGLGRGERVELVLPPGSEGARSLSVLLYGTGRPAGLMGPVELLPTRP